MTVRPYSEHVDAVTFDVWNTLLREPDMESNRIARARLLLPLLRRHHPDMDLDECLRRLNGAWDAYLIDWRRGQPHGPVEMVTTMLGEAGADDQRLIEDAATLLDAHALEPGAVVALDGAAQTVRLLQESGIPIGVISDTSISMGRTVHRLLERAGMTDFAVEVYSDEVGATKPARAMFRAAVDGLGASPGRTMHVGDLITTDIEGARAIGMRTTRIRQVYDDPSSGPEADLVVDSHREFQQRWLTGHN